MGSIAAGNAVMGKYGKSAAADAHNPNLLIPGILPVGAECDLQSVGRPVGHANIEGRMRQTSRSFVVRAQTVNGLDNSSPAGTLENNRPAVG